MAGIPSLTPEGPQTALTAAGNDPLLRQFRQAPAPLRRALLRIRGAEHMVVAAAAGLPARMLRLAAITAAQGQQLPDSLLLLRFPAGGTGIVPDIFAIVCRQVLFCQNLRQDRPDRDDRKILQLPQLQRAVGTGGIDPFNAPLP